MQINKILVAVFGLFVFWSNSALSLTPSEVIENQYLAKFDMGSQGADSVHDDDAFRFQSRVDAFTLRKTLVQLFLKNLKREKEPLLLPSDVWGDLELFSAKEGHLLNKAFPTQTTFGEVFGALVLAYLPTTNLNTITERQNTILRLVDEPALIRELTASLRQMRGRESILLDFYDKRHPLNTLDVQGLFPSDESLNKAFSKLAENGDGPKVETMDFNRSPTFIFFNLLFNRYIGVPLDIYLRYTLFRMTMKAIGNPILGSLFVLSESYFNSFLLSEPFRQHLYAKDLNAFLTRQLRELEPIVKTSLYIARLEKTLPMNLRLKLSETEMKNLESLREMILTLNDPEQDGHFYQSNLGKVAASLRILIDLREPLIRIIGRLGALDFYSALASKFLEEGNGFSMTHFRNNGPHIQATKLWNPLLEQTLAVPNDIAMESGKARNFVITGHNASGKSTLMRAVGIGIFLSQTLGIAPAEEMVISRFKMLASFMKNTDTIGERSSFQTEVANNRNVMNIVHKTLGLRDYAFLISDEPFRSTNMADATIASQIVLNFFCEHPQTMFMVSTHLENLTQFDKAESCGLVNKHMQALYKNNNESLYTYKIVDGVSPDTNELVILRKRLGE